MSDLKNEIPDFQSIMLPMLKLLEDKESRTLNEMMKALALHFQLTEAHLKLKVPSKQMGLFRNRVGWCRSYLKKAGLIYYPNRAEYQITQVGISLLKTNPKELRIKQLKEFPKYQEWQKTFNSNAKDETVIEQKEEAETETPDIVLEQTVAAIHKQLAFDVLETLKDRSPQFFENFVIELLQAMGYGDFNEESSSEVTGKSGDDGVDGIIYQDHLGLEAIYVQAKRFTTGSVGSPAIRNFIGALAVKGVNKGVFLTTSSYSKDAIRTSEESRQQKVVLVDGKHLAELAIKHNVGVQREQLIEIKKIDLDYFEE